MNYRYCSCIIHYPTLCDIITGRNRLHCFHVKTRPWIPLSCFTAHFNQPLCSCKPHYVVFPINQSHGSLLQLINCSQNPDHEPTSFHPVRDTELYCVPQLKHYPRATLQNWHTVARLVTEFLNLCKTQKFITLPWARLIHSVQPVVIYLTSILLSFSCLYPRLLKLLCALKIPTRYSSIPSSLARKLHAACTAHTTD